MRAFQRQSCRFISVQKSNLPQLSATSLSSYWKFHRICGNSYTNGKHLLLSHSHRSLPRSLAHSLADTLASEWLWAHSLARSLAHSLARSPLAHSLTRSFPVVNNKLFFVQWQILPVDIITCCPTHPSFNRRRSSFSGRCFPAVAHSAPAERHTGAVTDCFGETFEDPSMQSFFPWNPL